MKNVHVAVIIVLVLGACAYGTAPPPTASVPASQAEVIRVPEDLSGVEITLERTQCLGLCPCYTVVIDGDGRVKYSGREWVREQGERQAAISKDEVRRLLQLVVRAGFFSIDASYEPHPVIDAPIAYLTVKMGGRMNRLPNSWSPGADDFPPEMFEQWKSHTILNMLAHSVDRAVDIEHWIGSDEERNNPFR